MIVFFEKKGREMYMKKILLLIISLLSFVSVGSIGIVNAAANDSTITYERIKGAYFYLQDKTTGKIDTNHVTKFFMNGEIAYCIEPMVDINGKIYNSTSDWNITNLSEDVIKYMYDVQESEFERLKLKFKYINGRKLQYIDIQNLFCELDKYLRVRRPDLKSNRIKIKKKYIKNNNKIEYILPLKWNAKI